MACKFILVLVAMIAATTVRAGPVDNEAERAIGRSSELFAAKVYKKMKNEPGNLLICPVSVQTVLALVQAGADGKTSTEMTSALNFPEDKSRTQLGYKSLMNSLLGAKKVTMDIANRVYVKNGYELADSFKDIATKTFSSGVENVNFNDNQGAAKIINDWVEEKTHDKIKDLIKPKMITVDTRMVLVNALYFKGKWAKTFETYSTYDREFFLNEKDSVKVPMMRQTSTFRYAENAALDCKFLEMPYADPDYAMTIVLPNQRTGLAALEERMEEVLAPQQFTSERVEVTMPKFSIETEIDFKKILESLGMTTAFGPEANFKGLLKAQDNSPIDLYISDVIQKNFINVTEDGTEAASATAAVASADSLPWFKYQIALNHPFMLVLRRPTDGSILYIGRYATPH